MKGADEPVRQLLVQRERRNDPILMSEDSLLPGADEDATSGFGGHAGHGAATPSGIARNQAPNTVALARQHSVLPHGPKNPRGIFTGGLHRREGQTGRRAREVRRAGA